MTAAELRQIEAGKLPDDVEMVVLFGSRAKGSAGASSDWDLAVRLRSEPTDPLRIYGLDLPLARALGCSSDAVDVVNLADASYLLQRVIAEEGKPLFERTPGLFASFCSRAIRQWADWQCRQAKLARERTSAAP